MQMVIFAQTLLTDFGLYLKKNSRLKQIIRSINMHNKIKMKIIWQK